MTDDEIYEYLGQVFEWDRRKAAMNVLRHGIRFTEAATVIFDQDAVYEPDPDHSDEEDRFIVIGQSVIPNLIAVVHVYRTERTRIISARKPTRTERRLYESRLGR